MAPHAGVLNIRPFSPAVQYMNRLEAHPRMLEDLNTDPIGMRRMTDKQREATHQFVARELQADPTGFYAFHGEFGQGFKTGVDHQGLPTVEPSHPLRYGAGGNLAFQPGDLHAPTAFTDVHSHPAVMGTHGLNSTPSITDQRAARMMRQMNPDYKYALLQGADLKFYSFNGKLPLRHYELIDLGPGHSTPPRSNSPDFVPPLPPQPVPVLLPLPMVPQQLQPYWPQPQVMPQPAIQPQPQLHPAQGSLPPQAILPQPHVVFPPQAFQPQPPGSGFSSLSGWNGNNP